MKYFFVLFLFIDFIFLLIDLIFILLMLYIFAKLHYQRFFSHITAVNYYSKVLWAGCSERVLQYLVICKLSYSHFVSAGCHNCIRYLNRKYSDAHSLVRSIARAFTAHKLKEWYRKSFRPNLWHLAPFCSWPCMFSKRRTCACVQHRQSLHIQ